MRDVVRDAFRGFTAQYEGVVPWLYLDILGLVTVGIGNLVDPMSLAIGLPFVHRVMGRPATRDEVIAEWLRVKGDASLARLGHRAAERITTLRLTEEGINLVVNTKLEQNEAALLKRCPDMPDWPACAQLAIHSWAWACGPAANFPALMSALHARDFDAASVEIHINEWSKKADGTTIRNSGLIPRNMANKTLMRNAARVQAFKLDPDMLLWTAELDVSDIDTQPDPAVMPTVNTDIMTPLPDTTAADQPTIHVLRYNRQPGEDEGES